jgi:hypothetical protein
MEQTHKHVMLFTRNYIKLFCNKIYIFVTCVNKFFGILITLHIHMKTAVFIGYDTLFCQKQKLQVPGISFQSITVLRIKILYYDRGENQFWTTWQSILELYSTDGTA